MYQGKSRTGWETSLFTILFTKRGVVRPCPPMRVSHMQSVLLFYWLSVNFDRTITIHHSICSLPNAIQEEKNKDTNYFDSDYLSIQDSIIDFIINEWKYMFSSWKILHSCTLRRSNDFCVWISNLPTLDLIRPPYGFIRFLIFLVSLK